MATGRIGITLTIPMPDCQQGIARDTGKTANHQHTRPTTFASLPYPEERCWGACAFIMKISITLKCRRQLMLQQNRCRKAFSILMSI
jgi:hypothetical protein